MNSLLYSLVDQRVHAVAHQGDLADGGGIHRLLGTGIRVEVDVSHRREKAGTAEHIGAGRVDLFDRRIGTVGRRVQMVLYRVYRSMEEAVT